MKIYSMKDFEKFNVVEGLEEPVQFFTSQRGTFSVFSWELNKITCDFDFGWVGSEFDLVKLFDIDTSEGKIFLDFPLRTDDKRVIQAGIIEKYYHWRMIMRIIRNRKGGIVFALPEFEGVKWEGEIFIKINSGIPGIPNLQIALFSVKNKEDESVEAFLVFFYKGKITKKSLYFLVISVKSLENAYDGIQFFFPQNLKG